MGALALPETAYLGLDIGTTHLKAGLYNNEGVLLAHAAATHPLVETAGGYQEYQAETTWRVCCNLIKQVVTQAGSGVSIKALAACGMAEAGVPLGAAGEELDTVLPWHDPRPAQVGEWYAPLTPKDVYAITGTMPDLKYTVYKLLWLQRARPQVMVQTRQFCFLTDYVLYRLSGVCATSQSLACRTSLYSVVEGAWSEKLLTLSGVDSALFPPVQPSGTAIGQVTAAAAQETGLPAGAAVVLGGHDHLCSALGAGVTQPGAVLNSIGTAEVFAANLGRLTGSGFDSESTFGCHVGRHVLPNTLYLMGSVGASGGCTEWWLRTLRDAGDTTWNYERMIAAAQAVSPGSNGLLWLPHLLGARGPRLNSRSRGALVGITPRHSVEHITRAIYEGLAFEAKVMLTALAQVLRQYSGVTQPRVVAVGGGTKNDLWMDIKAAVLNQPIACVDDSDTATRGAAMLAAIGSAAYNWENVVPAMAAHATTREPRADWVQPYTEIYEVYYPLYNALKQTNEVLSRLQ